MKEDYEPLEINTILFDSEDIMCESNEDIEVE